MTLTFRVSSFLCLLAAFIWQIGTETQSVVGSHAEEEEKKLNIVFGNFSLKSTLPPSEDGTTTKVPPEEGESTEGEVSVLDYQPPARKNDSNLTGFDELRENVNKNDASPENSVDRESLEENDNIYKENSKEETPSMEDIAKESSVEYDVTSLSSKTTISYSATSEGDSSTPNASCSDEDTKCKNSPHVQIEHLASPAIEDKISVTTSGIIYSSAATPVWNVVKSVKRQEQTNQASSATFTPFKTAVDSEDFIVNTESSTTAQTSENIIPVEGSAINKLDSISDLTNKTERSKSTKLSENLNSSEDRHVRTFVKILTTTTMATIPKVNISDDDSSSTTLISKIFEAITTPTPLFSDFHDAIDTTSIDFVSPEAEFELSSKYDFNEKFIVPSPIPELSDIFTESYNPVLPLFTTDSWYNAKSSVSDERTPKGGMVTKSDTGITPRLLPSFRESSPSTEKNAAATEKTVEMVTTSSHQVTSETSYVTSSSPHLFASTLQPQLNSRHVVKNNTPVFTADKEEYIPPPRLTNPGCSSLPICIEITLLDTTWDEFCPQAREFQEFLSKAVSHIIHPIHPHQVILEADNCIQSPPVYPVQVSSDVTVALFVTDDSGEYAEKLTEICALILRKWAPTTFRNSALEVRMFSSELQATPMTIIPELNSGFVAAVSISAVAGVALCMLCILLVVMKQKLLQSRNSDTTSPSADAYSLDSLSINASFRRRRNRKSARSYLNHAFSDQFHKEVAHVPPCTTSLVRLSEIPSHPLNEKTLLNCLKNRELLEEEFKKIPMNMPKLDQIPEGAHVKNRYSNILPKPESRVILAEPSGDPLKCYINANYIKGYAGKANTYIACQAPLPEGIEDFWKMVWEQQCRVIIMLTVFEENGISRCATYFPQSTLVSHSPYGDFQVSLLKKDVYEFYTMSTLRLLDLEKNLFRDVVHLWYTNWPDVGVPKDPSSLIYFVQQCRSFINCNAGPTVVHCSTGTGRTGVFLTLDICMREYDESRSIDILQCISQLRRDRGGAVQNKDQYILIHEAMLEYISRMANQSQRSSLQN